MDDLKENFIFREICGRIYKKIDRWMDVQKDECWMFRRMNVGCSDGWMFRWMDEHMNRLKNFTEIITDQ